LRMSYNTSVLPEFLNAPGRYEVYNGVQQAFNTPVVDLPDPSACNSHQTRCKMEEGEC
jgi:hypothetical protein